MAFESCVEQLGSAIQLGVFPPGSKLPPERELAAKLSVSRATLREAISALRDAGFVTTTRGRGGGTVVQSIDDGRSSNHRENEDRRAEINDIVIFRSIIEPGASYQAASTPLTDEGKHLLTTCLRDFDNVSSPADYRRADARLHLAISSVCGSAELAKSCGTVQTKIHQFLEEIPFLQKNIEKSDEQHRKIVHSILEGDADAARFVMAEHCDATAALVKGLVK
jgi:GntR family transcriptional repressor for pyruvate dehydrogenase complex